MSGALGPGPSPIHPGPRRSPGPDQQVPPAARPHLVPERVGPGGGAQLLVVDPRVDEPALVEEMAGRGVRAWVTASTIDALVAFGRTSPSAVVVSPAAVGIPPADFVQTIRRFANPYVVAVLDRRDRLDVHELLLAGSSAVIEQPYDAAEVWELLQGSARAFADDMSVTYGALELDVRAFAVKLRGERLQDLPLKEFELLRALMSRAPEIVSNDELRLAVWGAAGRRTPDNTLAVHVTRLRARLQGTARIRRVRNRGYALTVD